MARVPRRPVPKHKHRVIHERVPKKVLRTQATLELTAPLNYTLVPAGNPKLTTACKDACRQRGLLVYVVTSSSNAIKFLLSHHINRLGYQFPTWVVTSSCEKLGIPLKTVDDAIRIAFLPETHFFDPLEQFMSQTEINEKAQNAIKDLFPEIPDADLFTIIERTFKKGSGKVGANRSLSWSRRASMAVLAHIRHVHTPYDRILQGKDGWSRLNWTDARREIEPICVDKLISWRGPDENGREAFEEVLREVIVISDGEDDDEEAQNHEIIHISSSPISPSPLTKQSSSVDTNKTLKRKYESDDSRERPVRGRRNEPSPMASHAPAFGHAPLDIMEPSAHVRPELTRQIFSENHGSPTQSHLTTNVDSRNLHPWGMGLPVRPAPSDSNMPVFVNGYNDIQQRSGSFQGFEYQQWDRTAPEINASSSMVRSPIGQFPTMRYISHPRSVPAFEVHSQMPVSHEHTLDPRHAEGYFGPQFPVSTGYVIHPRAVSSLEASPNFVNCDRPLTTRYADGYIRPVEALPPGVRMVRSSDPLIDRWVSEPVESLQTRRL